MVTGDGATPRVVVAEDNYLTAHLIIAALSAVGVPAATGRFGDQVVSLVDELRPLVIVVNLNFSRPSGLELLRLLRVRERGLRPIVMLNPGQADLRPQAQAYGARVFFESPFDPADLASAVLDELGGS
jgi:two-component system, response regulator, stage 0 sporulation protein F